MKKLISLFVIAALAFAIVGCSGSQDQAANPESTTTTTAPTDNAATPDTEGEKTGDQAAPATGTEGEQTSDQAAPAEGQTK